MTDTMNWLDQNAGGSGSPGVAFKTIGAKIVGTIASQPRKVDTEFGPRLVVELTAADGTTATLGDGTPINIGDEVTLWLKPGAMAHAVKQARDTAGVPGLSIGDVLAFAYTGDGVASKAGWNPPKQYAAKLQPAAPPSVSVDDLL